MQQADDLCYGEYEDEIEEQFDKCHLLIFWGDDGSPCHMPGIYTQTFSTVTGC